MSVKRFVAADMRRALELVRQEMGPDAVILSSRRIKQGVEILTSMEPPSAKPNKPSPVDMPITGVDVPMGSDGSWRDQLAVEKAVEKNSARIIGSENGFDDVRSQPQAVAQSSAKNEQRGMSSGKTSQQLAQEIDAARNRMLSAKKVQSAMEAPISSLARAGSSGHPTFTDDVDSSLDHVQSEVASRNMGQQDSWANDAQTQQFGAQRNQDALQQQKLDAMQNELADMRLLLEEQLTRMANAPKFDSPLQSALLRRLQQMGLVDDVAQKIVCQVKARGSIQEAWSETLGLLAKQLPAESSDPVMRGGVFALVGPTGVGKTTTLAKLAARYVLEHGAQNVTLVTTDTYRIAAQEQLRSLGRILGVQIKVVDDNNDLPSVLRSLKHCPLVLIDTAGFRNGEAMLKNQLDVIQSVPSVRSILVMASNSQYQTMKATVHAHKPEKLAGCILTKLDDTASLGEAISAITEHDLPLLYVTDGQEIPQDIEAARNHKLVAKAVSLLKDGKLFAQETLA